MLGWIRRLLGPPQAPPPRLTALVNRIDDVDARLEYLGSELRALRGRVTGRERKESREDAPSETIVEPDIPQHHPTRASSAHLARRFKGV